MIRSLIKNLEIRTITTFGLKIDFWQKQVGRHTLLGYRKGLKEKLDNTSNSNKAHPDHLR